MLIFKSFLFSLPAVMLSRKGFEIKELSHQKSVIWADLQTSKEVEELLASKSRNLF